MRIRMLKTENGSVDGIKVAQYADGTEYDLTATAGERDLASAFVGAGLAVDLDVTPADPVSKPDADPQADPAATEVPAEPAPKRGRRSSK